MLTAILVCVLALVGLVRWTQGDGTGARAAAAEGDYLPANLELLGEEKHTTIEPIDPTGVVGGLKAFDAIKNIPWAMKLARSWSPDAQLNKIDWRGMPPDGACDLTDEASRVEYNFGSRARDAAAREMAKVSAKIVWAAFTLSIQRSKISATVGTYTDMEVSGPVHDPVLECQPGRAVEVWRTMGLPFHRKYNLELNRRRGDGSFSFECNDWGVKELSSACVPL